MADYLEETGSTLRVSIRLTPNARTEGIGGTFEDADGRLWLKATVRAVPEDGKANAALVKLLAKQTGIAKSSWQLVQGHTSRLKVLEAAAATPEAIAFLRGLGK